MSAPKYTGYSWNFNKSINLYLSTMQHLIENAFKELAKKYNLPKPLLYSHNFILQSLYYHEEAMSLADISRESGQALPNVSTAAKLLKENGLITCTPDAHDKRKYNVSLSSLGHELCNDYICNYLAPISADLYKGISSETINAHHHFFSQVEKNIYDMQHNP